MENGLDIVLSLRRGVRTHEDKVAALQDKAGIDVVHPSRYDLGGEVWWSRGRHDWACGAAASFRGCRCLPTLHGQSWPWRYVVLDCSRSGCINTNLHLPGCIALKQDCSGCVSRRKISARAESRQQEESCCCLPCTLFMSRLTSNASSACEGTISMCMNADVARRSLPLREP